MTGHSNPEPQIIRLNLGPTPVRQQTPAQQAPPKQVEADVPDVPLLDHPLLGGKVTIGTILYGDYHDLHRRLLESLLRTVPRHRMELRIGLNQVCNATKNYITNLILVREPKTLLYEHVNNDMKYPVMRELIRDSLYPVTTPYLVWFDDDSYVQNPQWLSVLAETIIQSHPHGYRLYGIKFTHTIRSLAEAGWFKQARWHRGRHLQDRNGREAPNADKIHFVSGGFWAAETQMLIQADVPDVRLGMHGGDITIGEQIHQAGGRIKDFNRGKIHVHSSGSPPRGLSLPPNEKPLPWRTHA